MLMRPPCVCVRRGGGGGGSTDNQKRVDCDVGRQAGSSRQAGRGRGQAVDGQWCEAGPPSQHDSEEDGRRHDGEEDGLAQCIQTSTTASDVATDRRLLAASVYCFVVVVLEATQMRRPPYVCMMVGCCSAPPSLLPLLKQTYWSTHIILCPESHTNTAVTSCCCLLERSSARGLADGATCLPACLPLCAPSEPQQPPLTHPQGMMVVGHQTTPSLPPSLTTVVWCVEEGGENRRTHAGRAGSNTWVGRQAGREAGSHRCSPPSLPPSLAHGVSSCALLPAAPPQAAAGRER